MKSLFQLQLRTEFRRRSVLLSLLLYLLCLVFINYFSLGLNGMPLSPGVWSALFWMALLFTAVNTLAKSFSPERSGAGTYLYSLASPAEIIMAKMLYGFALCAGMSVAAFLLFSFLLTNPVEDTALFLLILILASYGFSASLTLISAIASKTNNSSVIMAVLSFPVIIGILVMAIRASKNCIDNLDRAASTDEMLFMVGINLIVTAVSYLLFPYIWRS